MFSDINRIFRKKDKEGMRDLLVPINDEILEMANITVTNFQSPSNITGREIVISDDAEKLNIIGCHFEKIHRLNANLSDSETQTIVNNTVNQFDMDHPITDNPIMSFDHEKSAD